MVAPPRINLRRAKSYNAQDHGPLSATSSRFNFNHLLFSPPPSPGLPSLVPRRKRTGSDLLRKPSPSRLVRLGVLSTVLISTLYVIGFGLVNHVARDALTAVHDYFKPEKPEMIALDSVPDFPTPIVTTDAKGQARWTFYVPPTYTFPLAPEQYSAMGGHCREASAQVQDMHHKSPLSDKTMSKYDTPDAYFMDVAEAETSGLLPQPSRKARWTRHGTGHFVGFDDTDPSQRQNHQLLPICQSSMTYVLESTDAGMGHDLMMLWILYGAAKEDGRAFFIDDSRWAYGSYSDIFQAPPPTLCRPPPRHHMIPCPFQARHLVVSAANAKDILPPLVAKYSRSKASTGDKTHDVWNLAHAGYKALFNLNKEDKAYVDTRVRDLKNRSKKGITAPDAPIIGLHVRRGDQHPIEYQYRDTYIPAEVFHEKAYDLAATHLSRAQTKTESNWRRNEPIMVLASDDPTMQDQPDFSTAVPAQQRIRLASKDTTKHKKPPGLIHTFREEASGWEGGFFAPIFWNLGAERKNNAANAPRGVDVTVSAETPLSTPGTTIEEVPEQTLKLRSLIGRAYMMDLAVLAQASDGIVCGVNAMGCKLLGAMMDWDKGVGGHGWVNIDSGYGWSAIDKNYMYE